MTTTLVLGGVRSGKSRYAENLLRDAGPVTYVAPGPVADGTDPDWDARIARHQAQRPDHWTTVETSDLVGVLSTATTPVLIDCLGTWLTSVIDELVGWEPSPHREWVLDAAVGELARAWSAAEVDVVAVTNEVGLGVVPPMASGRLFRDELGRLNARVSAVSERVVLVVAGRALDLSGAPVVGTDLP
jgi:adenosylcobinamide kinase / adenosylcobinamide-phosphate guanylyltransferase